MTASSFAFDAASLIEDAAALAEYGTWDPDGQTVLCASIQGRAAGYVMRWALRLLDAGADPQDVRKIISAGKALGLQRAAAREAAFRAAA